MNKPSALRHFGKNLDIRVRGLLHLTYPRQLSSTRLFLASMSKSGFNSKLAHKMRKDRNPRLIELADKFAVRKFVEERVGSKYLPRLIFAGGDTREILEMELPNEFVVKPNHASAAGVLVANSYSDLLPKNDENWGWQFFFTNYSILNRQDLVDLCNYWLSKDFYYEPFKFPEWAYKNISPKIVIEELLVGWNSILPVDYKFFVFKGEIKMIFVVTERFDGPKANLFDRDWNEIKGLYIYPPSNKLIEKPKHFEEMLNVAEALGEDIDFVRVDLYSTNKGVKFSEMTIYPSAAMNKIRPISLDKWLGKFWVQNY